MPYAAAACTSGRHVAAERLLAYDEVAGDSVTMNVTGDLTD
jgi:hypothetical protein